MSLINKLKLWWGAASGLVYVYVWEVFFQKLDMRHLGDVDTIGDRLPGLTVMVTGPTSGIGKATALSLAKRGAHVVLACRNLEAGRKLQAELAATLQAEGVSAPSLEVMHLDLASLKSVRNCAQLWEQRELHVLVNNAGVFTLNGRRAETEDGFELHLGTNHLGPFLLTLLLLPALRRGAARSAFGARVVNVTSSTYLVVGGLLHDDMHVRKPGSYWVQWAYGRSKLAQILFTRELRRRLGPSSCVQVFAVSPGLVTTNVTRSTPDWVQRWYPIIMGPILLNTRDGARSSVYSATAAEAPSAAEPTFGLLDSNCKPLRPAPHATDDEAARWLWSWSAAEVKLPPQFDLAL